MSMPHNSEVRRASIMNLSTGELHEFQYNPEQLRASLRVNYARKSPHASSHAWLQYRGTSNITIPLKLIFHRGAFLRRQRGLTGSTRSTAKLIERFESWRPFLYEMCYPEGDPRDPLRRAPPLARLTYPGWLAIDLAITGLDITDLAFDVKLRPVHSEADIQFEEHRIWRMSSSMARQLGMRRTGVRQ
jgi:hypothetical protein